jgi:hypothetical protein
MKGEVSRSGNFIEFNGDICDQTGEGLLREIEQALEEGALHLTLLIHSGGGLGDVGFMLYAKIKELLQKYARGGKPVPLWTYGVGAIASAAVVLFSVGDRRCMSKNAQLMFHESSVMFKPMMRGTPVNKVRDALVQIERDGCFCKNEVVIFLLQECVEGELAQERPDTVLMQQCNTILELVARGLHCCERTPVVVYFLQSLERLASESSQTYAQIIAQRSGLSANVILSFMTKGKSIEAPLAIQIGLADEEV